MTEPLIITTSKRDDHQIDMAIQLGPERMEEALRRGAKLVSKRAKIPGFRPGKAPYATVLRMFGRDALLGQIMEELGDEVYREALEVEHIEPYSRADLEDVSTDPVTFKLVVPLKPAVELGDYHSIKIEAPEVSVSEADVDQVLEQAQQQRATWQVVDRRAELGDTVVVDIRGTVGEDTIMDNHDWEIALVGGESGWLPGFDDAFVGTKAGDRKTFTLTYPAESASRYRGQEATFEATLKEVRARVRPEINDDFARSLGDYTDLADLRAKTLAEVSTQRASEAETAFNNKLIEALIEKTTFAYPPAAVEDMLDEMVSDTEIRVSDSGYKFEDFLRLQGMTLERYREQLRPAAERRLKSRLALSEFAEAEGITVAPEESRAELDRMANDASDENQAQRIRDTFSTEPGLWLIGRDLRTRKALARLREIATAAASEPGTPEAAESSEATGGESPLPATDIVTAESNAG